MWETNNSKYHDHFSHNMFDQNFYENMVYFSQKNNSFLGDEDPAISKQLPFWCEHDARDLMKSALGLACRWFAAGSF